MKKTHAEGYRKRYQNRVNFTYMFVRDPFERAVSSYFNKVLTGQILKNKSMTMENYFHYLNTANSNNEHFVTQLSLCNPCLSKFSFIGRSESLNSDFRFIVNEATDFHKLVSFRGNEEKFNDAKKEMDKYRTLTLESLFQFIWKFRHDYLAFGYNPHDAIKQITLLQKNFSWRLIRKKIQAYFANKVGKFNLHGLMSHVFCPLTERVGVEASTLRLTFIRGIFNEIGLWALGILSMFLSRNLRTMELGWKPRETDHGSVSKILHLSWQISHVFPWS